MTQPTTRSNPAFLGPGSRRSIAALAAVVLGSAATSAFAQPTFTDPNVTATEAARGFSQPTQVRFINPNQMFVTEYQTGIVKLASVGNTTGGTSVLNLNVATGNEQGLLGLTLHPNFATNGQVYVYYSATSSTTGDGGTWTDNRLDRYTWNGTTLTKDPTFAHVTFGTSADGQNNGPNHDGGPIRFGPDGKLYGITGDLNRDRAEQNNQTQSTASASVGGVYRLNADGSVPSDNPFTASGTAAVHKWYAYGVRNSYGINFDPVTNALWATENGPGSYDEINRVDRGFNSGWNKIMGPDSRDTQNAPGDLVVLPGSAYSDPEFSFMSPVAVTGITFLANTRLDQFYRDGVLVSANNTGELYLLRLNATRDGFVLPAGLTDLVADSTAERNLVRWAQGLGATTDLQVGPDGAIYAVSLADGAVYRIVPEPTGAGIVALAAGGLLMGRRRTRTRAG